MLLRFFDGTAQNSGLRLDNVNPTHLVLAGSKLALQFIRAALGGFRCITMLKPFGLHQVAALARVIAYCVLIYKKKIK